MTIINTVVGCRQNEKGVLSCFYVRPEFKEQSPYKALYDVTVYGVPEKGLNYFWNALKSESDFDILKKAIQANDLKTITRILNNYYDFYVCQAKVGANDMLSTDPLPKHGHGLGSIIQHLMRRRKKGIEALVLEYPEQFRELLYLAKENSKKDSEGSAYHAILSCFKGADLEGAKFVGLDLSRANFKNTKLWKADFTNAKLDKAFFTDANLLQATISQEQLDVTDYTSATLPDFTYMLYLTADKCHAINNILDQMEAYAKKLENDKDDLKAQEKSKAATQLVGQLKTKLRGLYVDAPTSNTSQKRQEFLTLLHSQDKLFAEHRGWTRLVVSIVICLTGVGLIPMAIDLSYKACTGRYFFFPNTTTENKIDKIHSELDPSRTHLPGVKLGTR